MDSNRSIEVDRDFRRQVRRAYYLTRDDFESESLYNDYLEGVEDLIDSLINEETRPAARAVSCVPRWCFGGREARQRIWEH